ncbi:50S ribosomal protein L28 [Patescibacteria group bacterium]|uniref:Large ribosomal subunit protein bL28 n=1 Tax=candidate division WWE3 bacterium TaxID=2053526 RepID=A0A928Y625_UNCKA|nr:50S ribosomal protein L28 [candidate division WWE3 bacterium]MCL4733252.1 50S ribosomal protein L28 [Patescibacteria group bacterium]
MAKVCQLCERGPASSQSRSHSKVATKRRHEINLQTKKLHGTRMRICTSCIKTIKKQAA